MMEFNIESVLSDLGISYLFYGNTARKKTFKRVATIQQGKENDLCYCSFDGEEAISIISKSNAGIILCKNSLKESLDQYYRIRKKRRDCRQDCSRPVRDNGRLSGSRNGDGLVMRP